MYARSIVAHTSEALRQCMTASKGALSSQWANAQGVGIFRLSRTGSDKLLLNQGDGCLLARMEDGSWSAPAVVLVGDRAEQSTESRAAVMRHPLHPILIAFPIAFFSGLMFTDAAYVLTGNSFWADVSRLQLAAGLVTGVMAAIPGVIDYFGIKRARTMRSAHIHAIGNAVALATAGANYWMRVHHSDAFVEGWGLKLTLATGALLGLTGWMGGEMSYRHRLGVTDHEVMREPRNTPLENFEDVIVFFRSRDDVLNLLKTTTPLRLTLHDATHAASSTSAPLPVAYSLGASTPSSGTSLKLEQVRDSDELNTIGYSAYMRVKDILEGKSGNPTQEDFQQLHDAVVHANTGQSNPAYETELWRLRNRTVKK